MSKRTDTAQVQAAAAPQARTLPRWEELPDFDLYMDQMISLMERYLGPTVLDGEKGITSSMVNNYVKIGLLPPPQKKKYSRIHLACLIVVSALKSVLPLAAIQEVLADELDEDDLADLYNRFCNRFEAAEQQAVADIVPSGNSQVPRAASISAALSAQAYRHVALSLFQS